MHNLETPPDPAILLSTILAMPVVANVLTELRSGLAPSLVYHSAAHTEAVILRVITLACFDGLAERGCVLLGVAAAFHDSGFLVRATDNESLGAEKARQALQQDGTFTDQEILCVETLIQDTKMYGTVGEPEQRPTTVLSGYLCDADLWNFGSPDFTRQSELVANELQFSESERSVASLIALLEHHRWHTNAGRRLLEPQKQENLRLLKAALAAS